MTVVIAASPKAMASKTLAPEGAEQQRQGADDSSTARCTLKCAKELKAG